MTLQRCLKTKGRCVWEFKGLVLHIHWERVVTLGTEAPFNSGPFVGRGSAVYCGQAKLQAPGEMSDSVLKGESGVNDTASTANEKCACFIPYKYAWLLQFLYCAIQYGFFLLHFELFLSIH